MAEFPGHSAIPGPRAAPSYNAPASLLLVQCGRSGGPSDRFSPCGRRADAFGCPAAAWEAASPASIAIAAQARLTAPQQHRAPRCPRGGWKGALPGPARPPASSSITPFDSPPILNSPPAALRAPAAVQPSPWLPRCPLPALTRPDRAAPPQAQGGGHDGRATLGASTAHQKPLPLQAALVRRRAVHARVRSDAVPGAGLRGR